MRSWIAVGCVAVGFPEQRTVRARVASRVWTRGSKRARPTVERRPLTRFGGTPAIVGQLSDESGAPIPHAVLDLAATATRPGSATRTLGRWRRDAEPLSVHPAHGFVPAAHCWLPRISPRHGAVGNGDTVANVRAGVTLNVRPRRASPRGRSESQRTSERRARTAGTQIVIYAVGGRLVTESQLRRCERTRRHASGTAIASRTAHRNDSSDSAPRSIRSAAIPTRPASSRQVTVRIR